MKTIRDRTGILPGKMPGVLILLTLVAFTVLHAGCSRKKVITVPSDFHALESEMTRVRMSDYFKSPLILIVHGGAWEPATREQLDVVNGLYEKYKGRGLELFFIGQGEAGFSRLRALKQKRGYEFDFFPQDDNLARVFGKYEILPHIMLVDSKGRVLSEFEGLTWGDRLEPVILKNLPGETKTP